jgi:hypothetical protein
MTKCEFSYFLSFIYLYINLSFVYFIFIGEVFLLSLLVELEEVKNGMGDWDEWC